MVETLPLAEQFRPRTLADLAGQEKAVQRITKIARNGYGGKAWFLSGISGGGKTTAARIIAATVAPALCTDEVNAREVDLSFVEAMERGFRQRPLPVAGLSGVAFILNEAHLFRGAILSRLLTTLEPGNIPPWAVVVLTTTKEGREGLFEEMADAGPFASRCHGITLTNQGVNEAFAVDCVRKCRDAGMLNGHPDDYYIQKARRVLKDRRGNYRALWSEVEAGLFDAD